MRLPSVEFAASPASDRPFRPITPLLVELNAPSRPPPTLAVEPKVEFTAPVALPPTLATVPVVVRAADVTPPSGPPPLPLPLRAMPPLSTAPRLSSDEADWVRACSERLHDAVHRKLLAVLQELKRERF